MLLLGVWSAADVILVDSCFLEASAAIRDRRFDHSDVHVHVRRQGIRDSNGQHYTVALCEPVVGDQGSWRIRRPRGLVVPCFLGSTSPVFTFVWCP